MFPRILVNSWVPVILLPQPPALFGLKEYISLHLIYFLSQYFSHNFGNSGVPYVISIMKISKQSSLSLTNY